MAQTGVLAQRYGEGLFRVVKETGNYQRVANELQSFLTLLETNAQIKDLLENPVYGTQERLSFLEGLQQKAGYSDSAFGLLYLLVDRNRIQHLESIIESYEKLYREELGLISAEVTVAGPIDSAAQSRIKDLVQKISGKNPEILLQTDPSIIGGLKIKMGNSILDASVRTKLEKLHQALLEPEQASS